MCYRKGLVSYASDCKCTRPVNSRGSGNLIIIGTLAVSVLRPDFWEKYNEYTPFPTSVQNRNGSCFSEDYSNVTHTLFI